MPKKKAVAKNELQYTPVEVIPVIEPDKLFSIEWLTIPRPIPRKKIKRG